MVNPALIKAGSFLLITFILSLIINHLHGWLIILHLLIYLFYPQWCDIISLTGLKIKLSINVITCSMPAFMITIRDVQNMRFFYFIEFCYGLKINDPANARPAGPTLMPLSHNLYVGQYCNKRSYKIES